MKKLFILLVLPLMALTACKSREEKMKQAQNDGAEAVESKASYVQGMGDALKSVGKGAAESISEGAAEVYNGLNTGFDKGLMKVTVKLDTALNSYVELGRTGKHTNDSTRHTDIVTYLVFKQDFKGKLVLKAYDKEKAELGRNTQEIDLKADEAGYIDFAFDERTPINLAEYFVLEKK